MLLLTRFRDICITFFFKYITITGVQNKYLLQIAQVLYTPARRRVDRYSSENMLCPTIGTAQDKKTHFGALKVEFILS